MMNESKFETQELAVFSNSKPPSIGIFFKGGTTPIMVCRTRSEAKRELKKLEAREYRKSHEAKAEEAVLDIISAMEARLADMKRKIKKDGLRALPDDHVQNLRNASYQFSK